MLTFTLTTLSRLLAALPLSVALAIGRGVGWIYGRVVRYHRKDAIEALRRSLPELDEDERKGIIKRMYASLGMNVIESMRLAGGKPRQLDELIHVAPEEIERTSEALKRNKGLLILTGHIGNYDMLSVRTPDLGWPLMILSKNIKNQALNDFWMAARAKYGLQIVPAHNSYRACRAALKRNELIGFILDQNMIDKEGVFVDFFGRKACTSPGLAFMAAQTQAPILPAFIVREPHGHHRLHLGELIEPPPDREPATMQAATQQYTHIIENFIRKHPDQWIWIHRRWRTQPKPGKPSRSQ